MKKLFTACLLAGVAPLAMASVPASAADAPKPVYFIFTGYAYPYFAPMADAVKQAASHYPGMTIKIVNANNSPSQEITDINEAVAAGAKGIILNTIQESVTGTAAKAMKAGVPIVTVDRDVADPSARDAFIGDNDVTLGKEETQAGIDALKKNNVKKPWHVVVLQGTLGASVSIGRLKGAMEVLQPLVDKGDVKIVLNQSADFATDKAQTMMSTELAKTTDIQLVVCGNDAMALGVIKALQTHNVKPGKDTYVVGADAQPESLQAVKAGTQLDTVTHSPFVEAYWAVEAMDNILENGTKPPEAKFPQGNVIIPMTVVTKANVDKIAAWGTPETIPPLPYGKSQAYKVTSSK
ncbi:MAG TPA: sugar ABC transporter substrate-binding protein [Pararhizobium sp.]|nr:sugar ABC transporter substrate-binding protein [Pararhizobium sp.]